MTEKTETKIWNQQDNEKDKPYYFFQQYSNIEEPITIDKFHEKMKKIGKENEISYKIPTLKTVYNWSSEYVWNNRKKAYRKYLLSKVGEELEKKYLSKLLNKFDLNDEIDLLILNEVKSILNNPNYKGNKAYAVEKLMKANNITVENQRLIAGEPTEIISSENKNWNANADVDKSDDLSSLFKNKIEEVKSDSDVSND